MNRRQFSRALLSTPPAWLWFDAVAQTPAAFRPVAGTHYVRLNPPVPINPPEPPGTVEVIEFFWYGCPHCFAFEPALDAWVKRLPGDLVFRRVPVAFGAEPFGIHQRIFYALDSLGQLARLHRSVFYAIHNERNPLDKPAAIAAFMAIHGIESARFMPAFDSATVRTKARQATQLGAAYKIDGVPALGIQGRYYTSISLAGGPDKALAVTDFLLQRVRNGA